MYLHKNPSTNNSGNGEITMATPHYKKANVEYYYYQGSQPQYCTYEISAIVAGNLEGMNLSITARIGSIWFTEDEISLDYDEDDDMTYIGARRAMPRDVDMETDAYFQICRIREDDGYYELLVRDQQFFSSWEEKIDNKRWHYLGSGISKKPFQTLSEDFFVNESGELHLSDSVCTRQNLLNHIKVGEGLQLTLDENGVITIDLA